MINKLNVFDLGTGNVTSLCSALKKINLDIPPPDPEMNQSEIENMINNDE